MLGSKNSSPLIVFYVQKKAIANWWSPFKEFWHSFEHMLRNLRINHTSKTKVFFSTVVKTCFCENRNTGAVWHGYIFPKYYSCVPQIISNCFLAAAQSKHWVKNLSLYNLITLSLYNLMAAKMIDELEIAYMSFCASYTVIMELDTKKKSRRKIWTRELLLKRNERGAYNEILNELRLNKC